MSDDNKTYVQAAAAEDPSKVKITESLIKFGVAVPLMLVLGNHLGGFLPLTFATETNISNHKRNISLWLILFLIIVSIAGSIDWSVWTKSGVAPALYPVMDFLASLFAFIFLLMTLRFTHPFMYVILSILIVATILVFYGAKASITTKVTEEGQEKKVLDDDASGWISFAQGLIGITAFFIVIMYLLSIKFVNANYSDLFETSGRFYNVNNTTNELDVYNVNFTPEVGFFDYMFHPQPVKDAAKFREVVRTKPLLRNGAEFISGNKGSHGQKVSLPEVPGLSNKMSEYNEVTKASKDYIMSVEKIPDPSALWNGIVDRTFPTDLVRAAESATALVS
jgi:hypothetical protein